MQDKLELKRQWQDKVMCLGGLALIVYVLVYRIVQHGPILRIIWDLILIALFSWTTWVIFTRPDALITDKKIYLFGRISPKPLVLTLNEIQLIERHLKAPIWRVPLLTFYMKNGDKITFSTDASEGRMKRIIKFIEDKTAMRIKYS